MKKVKFNCSTSIIMIPDEKYQDYKASIEKLEDENYEKYINKLLSGSKFAFKTVNIGDVVTVPDWYFEAHKNDIVSIANSFDKYKDEAGKRIPFNVKEAVKHGDMQPGDKLIKTIKKFELTK